MVVNNEVIRSIWLGRKFVSFGETNIRGKEVVFKKWGGVPFLDGYVPLFMNASNTPYQDRNLLNPRQGDTGMKVRLYFSDILGDKYYAITNPQDLYTINHLKNQITALQQELNRLYDMLYDASNTDRIKKRIKNDIENYNAIKGFGYGGYGGGSYMSPHTLGMGGDDQM